MVHHAIIQTYGNSVRAILINTDFNNPGYTNMKDQDSPTYETCADSLCVGPCSATDATDEKLGVTCYATYAYGPANVNATGTGYAIGARISGTSQRKVVRRKVLTADSNLVTISDGDFRQAKRMA